MASTEAPSAGHMATKAEGARIRHGGATAAAIRATIFAPPDCCGMITLDKAAFVKTVPLKALRIEPRFCNTFLSAFKKQLLNLPRTRNIVTAEEGQHKKLVLLCPSIESLAHLSEAQQATVATHGAEIVPHTLKLDFDFWSTEQILRAALPADVTEITTSFETIGHIVRETGLDAHAHMNLRDDQLKHKTLIGEVILAKNKMIKTVVNKSNTINAVYRFFEMELLAGESNFIATLREGKCTFKMPYDKVYWNSRLQTEHGRVVSLLNEGDVVLDMMAGIGPFALPAAKKGCRVYANDLNPESYEALKENIMINRVSTLTEPFNLDAREFVRTVKKRLDSAPSDFPVAGFHHAVMNLPASATQFLDVFRGLYAGRADEIRPDQLPMIHCYCFSKAENIFEDAIQLCESGLGGSIDRAHCTVHEVRDVAPRKRMMCVSFRLPPESAFAVKEANEDESAVINKKRRVDTT